MVARRGLHCLPALELSCWLIFLEKKITLTNSVDRVEVPLFAKALIYGVPEYKRLTIHFSAQRKPH